MRTRSRINIGAAVVVLILVAIVGPLYLKKRSAENVPVTIGQREFLLELAADDPSRQRGLGGRTEIAENGGMIFVFPEPQEQLFVMRDCVIPIDLIFLDESGRVLSVHSMQPEPPRSAIESNSPDGEAAYMARLKGYASEGEALFAIEVRGGVARESGIERGHVLKVDARGLVAEAK